MQMSEVRARSGRSPNTYATGFSNEILRFAAGNSGPHTGAVDGQRAPRRLSTLNRPTRKFRVKYRSLRRWRFIQEGNNEMPAVGTVSMTSWYVHEMKGQTDPLCLCCRKQQPEEQP